MLQSPKRMLLHCKPYWIYCLIFIGTISAHSHPSFAGDDDSKQPMEDTGTVNLRHDLEKLQISNTIKTNIQEPKPFIELKTGEDCENHGVQKLKLFAKVKSQEIEGFSYQYEGNHRGSEDINICKFIVSKNEFQSIHKYYLERWPLRKN